MIDRRTVTASLLAGAATSMIGARMARAQTQSFTRARNVVLVHGLYADGSCWLKVIPLLQQAGLNVTAVQNPLRSLDEDCEFTRRTLARIIHRGAVGPRDAASRGVVLHGVGDAGNRGLRFRRGVSCGAHAPFVTAATWRRARQAWQSRPDRGRRSAGRS